MKKIKQIWMYTTGNMPMARNVLVEKLTLDKDGICLFINGIKVYAFYDEQYLEKNKIYASKENFDGYVILSMLFINMPLESIVKDSKILWRLSKYYSRAKAYKDSINNKIVINRI